MIKDVRDVEDKLNLVVGWIVGCFTFVSTYWIMVQVSGSVMKIFIAGKGWKPFNILVGLIANTTIGAGFVLCFFLVFYLVFFIFIRALIVQVVLKQKIL